VKRWLLLILLIYFGDAVAQDDSVIITPDNFSNARPAWPLREPNLTSNQKKQRSYLIGGIHTGVYGGMFVGLSAAWYKDYQRSSFHVYNDAKEWQQMDKVGHAWTVYTASRWSYGMFTWAGMKNTKATLLSSGSALAYMLSIEYLDGRSAAWGWSWPDVASNVFGAALFTSQQLGWKEQKIVMKFSSHRVNYEPELEKRANDLFGKSLPQRLLKDYNGQTYWLTFPLPKSFPSWLKISAGYGAKGMLGGYDNIAFDDNHNVVFDRRDIKRQRQFYISPDIDLSRIKTRSKVLRTVFYTFNSLKFPAPALELSGGKLKGKWLMF
jgi:uncharacterized protein YfiM (DUF2279 family)